MPEEDEKKEKEPRHPEVTFLPPLNMVLAFFDKKKRKPAEKKEADASDEKTVEKLIEKLSEKKEDE
jgi:hypothetical protein